MKSNTLKYTIWAFVLTVIPFAYLAYLWDNLPAKLALGIGKSSRIGSKEQLLERLIIVAIVGLAFYFIMAFYKTYDPKQSIVRAKSLLIKFGLMNVAFLSALSVYTIHTGIHHRPNNFLSILTGLWVMTLANYMYSIPYQHPLGLRLSWVRESEENWRKTHRLYSVMGVVMGFIMVITGLFLPEYLMSNTLMALSLIATFVPIIYSYWLS
jgi:uncharacterized membrane protein